MLCAGGLATLAHFCKHACHNALGRGHTACGGAGARHGDVLTHVPARHAALHRGHASCGAQAGRGNGQAREGSSRVSRNLAVPPSEGALWCQGRRSRVEPREQHLKESEVNP